MDDIFGWHGNLIKSCSIRNDSHLVIYYLKTYASTECLKQTSTLQTFAFIMNWMEYHIVSSFVTYGSFLCQHEASKIKNTIVRNSFSAVVYTACNITHTIEKPIAAPSVSSENFFRWFYMKEHH